MEDKIRKVLSNLNRQANKERRGNARVAADQQMLAITADTGIFFSILLKTMRARHILEVGTSTGFSTLWFADAITRTDTRHSIITIEQDHRKAERARQNFQRAGIDRTIEIREGRAIDVLQQIKKRNFFDFVFLDADKENLVEYFDLVLPMVRRGGIIAADNMLYPEQYRQWMKRYIRHVRSKSTVQSITVPIGMGEEITLRLR